MQCLTDIILQDHHGKRKLYKNCYIWLTDTDELLMFDWYKNGEQLSYTITECTGAP